MQDQSTSRHSLSITALPHRLPMLAGFLVLAVMAVVLFGMSMQQAWLSDVGGGTAVTILVALILISLVREARTLFDAEPSTLLSRSSLLNFTGVVGGGLVTYLVNRDVGLGAVVASGTVGLLGALIFPNQAVAIYCGSFVGMVSPALLGCCSEVLLAGLIAGAVFVLATDTFSGFGGKLGTIAFTGTVVTPVALGCEFVPSDLPPRPVAWQIMAVAVVAGVATYWLSVDLEHGAVMGSSVVGLLGGLFLPALVPESGALLAVVAICASFTGMSSPARIPDHLWMTVAGVFTGLVFVYSMPCLGGAGGKLGTLAFGSGMATFALRSVLDGIGVPV